MPLSSDVPRLTKPPPRRPVKTLLPVPLFAVLVCLAGCGLGDYEARMRDAQAHGAERQAERARQEALQANLGDPLHVPAPPEVFLRAPKGIFVLPDASPTYRGI